MKKLITANDVREADGNGLKTITFVLKESIVTPEARVVAEQLGIALVEEGANPLAVTTDNAPPRSERQRIREEIISQLPEGQFTETLVAQLIEKVEQEQKTRSGSGMQPGFSAITGKGGIKVIDGSSVRFGRFDGAQEPCVGLTDLVTGADGSSMAAGFMQWENGFFPWTLNYDEIDMVLEGELHIRHEGETLIGKAGDVMFIPKGSSIEFGTTSQVRFLYVAWPANWQEC